MSTSQTSSALDSAVDSAVGVRRHRHVLRSGAPYIHAHVATGRHLSSYSLAHWEGEGDPDAERDPCGNPDCSCASEPD